MFLDNFPAANLCQSTGPANTKQKRVKMNNPYVNIITEFTTVKNLPALIGGIILIFIVLIVALKNSNSSKRPKMELPPGPGDLRRSFAFDIDKVEKSGKTVVFTGTIMRGLVSPNQVVNVPMTDGTYQKVEVNHIATDDPCIEEGSHCSIMTIDDIDANNVRINGVMSLDFIRSAMKTMLVMQDSNHKPAKVINVPGLDKALTDFYSSYYYDKLKIIYEILPGTQMRFRLSGMQEERYVLEEATRVAEEIREKGYAQLCACQVDGIGKALLCYDTKTLFLLIESHDPKKYDLEISLETLLWESVTCSHHLGLQS